MKSILLIGSGGKTGIWYTRLLLKEGFIVFAYDQNQKIEYPKDIILDTNFNIVTQDEFQNYDILNKVDQVTLSPGVPLNQILIKTALKTKKETKKRSF